MRRFPIGVASLARWGVLGLVVTASAGCSSNITRLSYPFFNDTKDSEVTGSLGTVPREPIPGPGAAPRTEISSAPLGGPSISSSPVEQQNIPRASGDGFSVVRAEPGDTAYSLSRRYGVSARSIMAANNMINAEDVRAGQDVRIPPIGWQPGTAAPAAPRPVVAQPAPRPMPVAAPAPAQAPASQAAYTMHTVQSGETLWGISRKYGMRASDVAQYNDLQAQDSLRVGQKLKIPGQVPAQTARLNTTMSDAAPPTPATRPVVRNAPQSLQPLPAPEPRQVSGKSDRNDGAREEKPTQTAALDAGQQTASKSTKLPEPPSLSGPDFRWPVRGRVISEFGSKPNGAQNDGINVAVPEGTSVKAAENGVVAYVGNELKGFGNLVLIRHADDWVTAYAHNSQILVKRGDQVTRGQIIAKAGQTGSVRQPQLHFELRKGSRPVDPLPHLAGNS